MNLLHETIPMLVKRALSFEADRSGDLRSLMAAEKQLIALGTPRENERWTRNTRAEEIAKAWHSITGDADKAIHCLHASIGSETSARAFIELASAIRSTLGIRWDDRSQDEQMRRYLLQAEEFVVSCEDWCKCASGWHFLVRDTDRALNCIAKAENDATNFFDYLRCASAWETHDYEKAKYWVARASEKAVTAYSWQRCAHALRPYWQGDPETKVDVEHYLAKAEELIRTREGYISWVSCADLCLGPRGIDSVMRGLINAEKLTKSTDEWRHHVTSVMVLIFRAQHFHEPFVGIANVEELESYYRQCLKEFKRRRPKTEDWLKIVCKLLTRDHDDTHRWFMSKAAKAARSTQDWQDCASYWSKLKLPEAKKKACMCRRRAMAMWRGDRLP